MEPWDGMRLPPAELFASLRDEVETTGKLTRGRLDLHELCRSGRVRWCKEGEAAAEVSVESSWLLGVKWPGYWRYLGSLPRTRFIVCLRDPYDVIASFKAMGGRVGEGLQYDTRFNREMNRELQEATSRSRPSAGAPVRVRASAPLAPPGESRGARRAVRALVRRPYGAARGHQPVPRLSRRGGPRRDPPPAVGWALSSRPRPHRRALRDGGRSSVTRSSSPAAASGKPPVEVLRLPGDGIHLEPLLEELEVRSRHAAAQRIL